MVGGRNYDASPFNLATEGERQPGSSFKAFDLAGALEDGISPDSVWASKEKTFIVPNTGGHGKVRRAQRRRRLLRLEHPHRRDRLLGQLDLRRSRPARSAPTASPTWPTEMGITTPISTNPAMTIGGLKVGVTPLDMAHAYETIAHGGQRVSGTLAEDGAPVGIQEVLSPARPLPDGSHRDVNQVQDQARAPPGVAVTETEMLETVLQYGTARAAALGEFAAGKTGTTENYGDAWFVGWNHKYTVAVWVGYPNGLVPMTTDFNGRPRARRHVPGVDLARLHDLRSAHRQDPRRTGRRGRRRTRGGQDPRSVGRCGHEQRRRRNGPVLWGRGRRNRGRRRTDRSCGHRCGNWWRRRRWRRRWPREPERPRWGRRRWGRRRREWRRQRRRIGTRRGACHAGHSRTIGP